ncbi:hypothetical protein ACTZWW_11305 [Salinarimonas sp. NSM]|uniref:hypothetical protein n=1 Tax=Salinarimonas sp. NSM TaxID=3458003 RepID=UPI0040363F1F
MANDTANRSVTIGGSATNTVIITGSGVTAAQRIDQAALPPPAAVDPLAEIRALKPLLLALSTPRREIISGAMAEAEHLADQPDAQRDPDGIAGALDRAVRYARGADDLSAHAAAIAPRVAALASWLGERGKTLLDLWNETGGG